MTRTIAIGDIHGCSKALASLVEAIAPTQDDTLVILGDFIDRGPDSRGVVDQLIGLQTQCRLVTLRGNHEQMMLDARRGFKHMALWHINGGYATLDSYDAEDWKNIPSDHMRFISSTRLYFETGDYLFVHASYNENEPFEQQAPEVLLWRHLSEYVPGPHSSGKTAVVGHTIMDRPLNIGHLVCLDTGCFTGDRLTAMEVNTRTIWQSTIDGRLVIDGDHQSAIAAEVHGSS